MSNINFSISWGSIKIVILKLILYYQTVSPHTPAFAAFHKNGEVSSISLLVSSFLTGIHIKYKRLKSSFPNELYRTLNCRIGSVTIPIKYWTQKKKKGKTSKLIFDIIYKAQTQGLLIFYSGMWLCDRITQCYYCPCLKFWLADNRQYQEISMYQYLTQNLCAWLLMSWPLNSALIFVKISQLQQHSITYEVGCHK